MSIPSPGQYKIFNAMFSNQDADLLFGLPTTTITGYPGNSSSLNMVWNLNAQNSSSSSNGTHPWNNLVTLTNAAPSANGAYASAFQATSGAALYGSSGVTSWSLQETSPGSGQYQILAPVLSDSCSSTDLGWSLVSDDKGAPIILAPIDYTAKDLSQVWIFKPQKAGNVVGGINDLD